MQETYEISEEIVFYPMARCEHCGRYFEKKYKRHRFCSDNCRYKNWYKPRITHIECACCGKTIIRKGPRQRVCQERCEPREGMEQRCARCGEVKPYDEFYDYRGTLREDATLKTTCKECIRKETRKNWRKKNA